MEKLGNEFTFRFRESIRKQTEVSLCLAKQIIISTLQKKDTNLVCSPLSIQVALALVAVGSSGPTQKQLLEFLKCDSLKDLNSLFERLVSKLSDDANSLGGPTLSFANSIWTCLKLNPDFKQIVNHTYHTDSHLVACFSDDVRKEVNSWAEKKTKDLIKEVLPPHSVNEFTRLIFANALYFKGTWDQKFDSTKTKNDNFFLLDGTSIQVPFMTTVEKQYVKTFDGFKVLKLPYKQGEDQRSFSMLIYLPNDKNGLPILLEKINMRGFIASHLPENKVLVNDFKIPKFKIDFWFEASGVLKMLGLKSPFLPGGLTEMVQNSYESEHFKAAVEVPKLHVANIFQKSFIEVNEQGTEAAVATGTYVKSMSIFMLDFVADHPFLFVIREESDGIVFFIGQVLKP